MWPGSTRDHASSTGRGRNELSSPDVYTALYLTSNGASFLEENQPGGGVWGGGPDHFSPSSLEFKKTCSVYQLPQMSSWYSFTGFLQSDFFFFFQNLTDPQLFKKLCVLCGNIYWRVAYNVSNYVMRCAASSLKRQAMYV
jgi:hypothetical protein